jgi:NodT family efflux transporter outer membrane factor (OMF) lipoprotein
MSVSVGAVYDRAYFAESTKYARSQTAPTIAFLLIALLLSGCKVGPNYRVPVAPATPNFKEPPPSNFKENGEWKPADPQDTVVRESWWESFADPDLNALEDQVNVSNQNIATAEAQFRSARAAIRVARAPLFPTVTAGASATKSQNSSGFIARPGSGGTGTFYQIPIDLTYEVDLWGRIRRTIEANVDTAQASGADVETIRLSMHSELALDYFQLRGLDEELRLFQASIMAYEEALQLTTNRYNQGIASALDVSEAQTQVDTTRGQAIDLGVMRAAFEHAIAVLIGKPPADLTIAPVDMTLQPPAIPAGLPSELLERRPDVAAAERRAAAANANIGVAKAAYYPRLTFSATAGLQSSAIGNLLSWPSRFWSLGPALAETVFDAGARRGVTQEAEANYDAAVAIYRQSVLTAFQDVEDNLAALRILSEESAQQDVAIASSQRTLDLSLNQYRGGITTYLNVIIAQNALLANQRAGVLIHTRRMQAAVLLIKALGGGWNTRALPKVN